MIPPALRPHLESLGAHVEPQMDFSTAVHIPGSSHRYLFHPSGHAYEQPLGAIGWTPATWPVGTDFHELVNPEDPANPRLNATGRLLGHMGFGERRVDTPHHHLHVTQMAMDNDEGRFQRHFSVNLEHPTDSRFDLHLGTYPQAGAGVQAMKPETEQLIREAMANPDDTGMHALIDHLKENYAGPHQYARSYADAIRPR